MTPVKQSLPRNPRPVTQPPATVAKINHASLRRPRQPSSTRTLTPTKYRNRNLPPTRYPNYDPPSSTSTPDIIELDTYDRVSLSPEPKRPPPPPATVAKGVYPAISRLHSSASVTKHQPPAKTLKAPRVAPKTPGKAGRPSSLAQSPVSKWQKSLPPETPSRVSKRLVKVTVDKEAKRMAHENEEAGVPGMELVMLELSEGQKEGLENLYKYEAEMAPMDETLGRRRSKGGRPKDLPNRGNPFFCIACSRTVFEPREHAGRHISMLPNRCPIEGCTHRTFITAEFEQHIERKHARKARKIKSLRTREVLRKVFPLFIDGNRYRFAKTAFCQLCRDGESQLPDQQKKSHILNEHLRKAQWTCPVDGCTYEGSLEDQKLVARHIAHRHRGNSGLKPISQAHKYGEEIEVLLVRCFTLVADSDSEIVDSDSDSDSDSSVLPPVSDQTRRRKKRAAPDLPEASDSDDADFDPNRYVDDDLDQVRSLLRKGTQRWRHVVKSNMQHQQTIESALLSDGEDVTKTPKRRKIFGKDRKMERRKDRSEAETGTEKEKEKGAEKVLRSGKVVEVSLAEDLERLTRLEQERRANNMPNLNDPNNSAPTEEEMEEYNRANAEALTQNGTWYKKPTGLPSRPTVNAEASDDEEAPGHSFRPNRKLIAKTIRMNTELAGGGATLQTDGNIAGIASKWGNGSTSDAYSPDDATPDERPLPLPPAPAATSATSRMTPSLGRPMFEATTATPLPKRSAVSVIVLCTGARASRFISSEFIFDGNDSRPAPFVMRLGPSSTPTPSRTSPTPTPSLPPPSPTPPVFFAASWARWSETCRSCGRTPSPNFPSLPPPRQTSAASPSLPPCDAAVAREQRTARKAPVAPTPSRPGSSNGALSKTPSRRATSALSPTPPQLSRPPTSSPRRWRRQVDRRRGDDDVWTRNQRRARRLKTRTTMKSKWSK